MRRFSAIFIFLIGLVACSASPAPRPSNAEAPKACDLAFGTGRMPEAADVADVVVRARAELAGERIAIRGYLVPDRENSSRLWSSENDYRRWSCCASHGCQGPCPAEEMLRLAQERSLAIQFTRPAAARCQPASVVVEGTVADEYPNWPYYAVKEVTSIVIAGSAADKYAKRSFAPHAKPACAFGQPKQGETPLLEATELERHFDAWLGKRVRVRGIYRDERTSWQQVGPLPLLLKGFPARETTVGYACDQQRVIVEGVPYDGPLADIGGYRFRGLRDLAYVRAE